MSESDIKIIKWGLIFFSKPGVVKLSESSLAVKDADGQTVFESPYSDIKKVNYNSINGIWTVVASNKDKTNIVIEDEAVKAELLKFLEKHNIGGLKI